MNSTTVVDVAGSSHVGRQREFNEDQFLIAELTKSMQVIDTTLPSPGQRRLEARTHGHLFVVADGMGGHAAGELASAVAVEAVVNFTLNTLAWFFRLDVDEEDDFVEELESSIKRVQSKVAEETRDRPERVGMGTTLTMAYVLWPRMYVIHVGDSRCYLLRDGAIHRITRDHTLAQLHVDEGIMTPEQAERSDLGNVLIRAIVGSGDPAIPDVHTVDLQASDVVILCSDGLTRHVSDQEILALNHRGESAAATCQELVDAANAGGGEDNITVVAARLGAPA